MTRWLRAALAALVVLPGALALAGDYAVLSAEDLSSGDFFRVRARIETKLPVTAEVAESIARDLVTLRTARRALHVFEVVIHTAGEVNLDTPAAYVVWAKDGDPLVRPTGAPGDYSAHRYVVRLGAEAAAALAMRSTDLAGSAAVSSPTPVLVAKLPPASAVSPSSPLPPDARRSMASAEATTLLSRWLAAWEAKLLDDYAAFYAPSFRSGKMDRAAWLAHKEKVFANTGALSIQANDIDVQTLDDGARAIVKFLQIYRSDAHEDRGRKTLVLTRVGDDLRIVGEEWSAIE